MSVDRIEVVQLPVADLARAGFFYHDVLGRPKGASSADEGPGSFLTLDFPGGGPSLHLQTEPAPHTAPNRPVLALQLSGGTDVASLLQAIESGGGNILYRDVRTPELLLVGVLDPEGNHLELLIPY